MNALEILLVIAGFSITALVIAGMVLLTPSGTKDVHAEKTDPVADNLSQAQPAVP
ncbi:hypothetical protein OJ998_31615 [Solirubrobacter taibaiensis]|nr:hypothetical protein [Solirubrobacter taibaiensis]